MLVHVDAAQIAPSGPGCTHVALTLTAAGRQRVVLVDRAELISRDPDDDDTLQDRLVARLRSAIKEAGATTPAQARAAILGKDFSL